MIQFFRKFRQGSLTQNKTATYLVYAAGEIVLVVIGILIALQIDTWKDNYQQRQLEIKYLAEIRNSLISDLTDIEFNIVFNEDKLKSNKAVLQFLNKEKLFSDSLHRHLGNLMGATRTIVNTSAYETVKSRGLEIISNDTLRQTISKLYSFTFYNVIDFETQDDHKFQYESFVPEIVKELNIITLWEYAEPVDRERLLNNAQFKNALSMNISYREYMLRDYRDLYKEVTTTIDLLRAELARLQ